MGDTIFDNDDAADWVYELEESEDLSLIAASLAAVTETPHGEYLESPVCARALAAAGMLAGILQNTRRGLPEEVQAWFADHRSLDGTAYREMAIKAVERCRDDPNSELREQWEETSDFAAWHSVLDKLITRLR